jgi:hypothetical protein
MYELLSNLNERVASKDPTLAAEAQGEIEEQDIRHLWHFENRRVPQSLPVLFKNVSLEAKRRDGEIFVRDREVET